MNSADNTYIISFLEQYEATVKTLMYETDLGCVLVGVNFLDLCLKLLLKERLENDMSCLDSIFEISIGNLSNFSSKIKLSEQLNIISKEQRLELKKLSEIRNKFAHSYKTIKFSDTDIIKKCAGLKLCNDSIRPSKRYNKPEYSEKTNHEISKLRFVYSVMNIMSNFFADAILRQNKLNLG